MIGLAVPDELTLDTPVDDMDPVTDGIEVGMLLLPVPAADVDDELGLEVVIEGSMPTQYA